MNRLGSAAVEKEKPPDYATAGGFSSRLLPDRTVGTGGLEVSGLAMSRPVKWGLIQGTLNMDQVPRITASASLETGRPLIDIVNSSGRYAEDKTSRGFPFKS